MNIQKHPTIAIHWHISVPPPAEESFQPRPLDLGKGVPGHRYDAPACVDDQNLRPVDIGHPVLSGKGVLVLLQIFKSLGNPIPRLTQNILRPVIVIQEPFYQIF